MATMKAFRLLDWQRPETVEVPVPEPGPGEVLVRVAGVGLCHSDIQFMDVPPGVFGYPLPFTLGHETAGWVAAVGAGVSDLPPHTPVIAAAHYWCGRCENCVRGLDHLCVVHTGTGPGYGADGGLAEYVLAPRNTLVGLGSLDPRTAGPLADAAATAYRAVRGVLQVLRPGSTAIVIGVGGLGGYGVQLLRLLSGTRIIAVDTDPRRLETARGLGADETIVSDDQLDGRLQAATAGRGAHAILDFVGSDETITTALSLARPAGAVAIIGAGGGSAAIGWGRVPVECHVFLCFANTLADLQDVVALAQAGHLRRAHETFRFDEVGEAYARLRRGELSGRAVVVMD